MAKSARNESLPRLDAETLARLCRQLDIDPSRPIPRLVGWDKERLAFWAEMGIKLAGRSMRTGARKGRPKRDEPFDPRDKEALIAIMATIDNSSDRVDPNSAIRKALKKYPIQEREAARHRLVRYWDKQPLPAGLGALAYLRALSKNKKPDRK